MAEKRDELGRQLSGTAGNIYRNKDTATADTARRFETTQKILKDVIIRVKTFGQFFGDSSTQDVPVEAGEWFSLTGLVDISTLYFKNDTSGENGVVHILGVEV